MKIGNIYITFMGPQQRRDLRDVALSHIGGPDGSLLISKMARSEVKNYLAKLAEEAEMPFGSADAFLRVLRTAVDGIAEAREVVPFIKGPVSIRYPTPLITTDENDPDTIIRGNG
jgi:hypothetical protein